MRVVVCLKQIIDPEIPPKDFKIDASTKKADATQASLVINPFDENALEMALQLADKSADVEVIDISFGLETVKDAVRKALAVKASEGVVITSDKDIRYDATATAMILSRAIKKLGNVDLVICGRQAGDWDAGQVGPILAEMLDIPCISFARKIEREGDLLVITHEIEDGVEVVEVKPPLLVSATNHEGNVLRLAKVKDVIAAQRKPLTSWDLNDLGISPDDIASNAVTELQNLYIPEVSGHCEFISAETAEEKTDALIAKLESLKLF